MKYSLLFIIVFYFSSFNIINAQERPVEWTFSTEKIDDKTAYFIIEAEIAEAWRVFGQFPYRAESVDSIPTIYIGRFPANSKCDNDAGPTCLEVVYTKNNELTFGQIISNEIAYEKISPVFQATVIYYENRIRLKQRFKKEANQKLEGYLTYMACNHEKCHPPIDIDFSIAFPE